MALVFEINPNDHQEYRYKGKKSYTLFFYIVVRVHGHGWAGTPPDVKRKVRDRVFENSLKYSQVEWGFVERWL